MMDGDSSLHTKLAERFGIPLFLDLSHFPFVKEKVRKLPYHFTKEKHVLPLEETEESVLIAIAHPYDLETLEELRTLFGKEVKEVYCPIALLDETIESCYHQKESEASEIIQGLSKGAGGQVSQTEGDEYDLLEKKGDSPIIHMLNVMLSEAIQQGASDIHFEPSEEGMGVRYRIDGVLQMRHAPPREYQTQLTTRIKVMAKLDIAEHRLPQDGRIKLKMGGRQIDFRVSTVPVVYGERIVLRILDKSNVLLGMSRIGMPLSMLDAFRKHIRRSEGIVLVTGPTGSGKTTTLYSAIAEINSSEFNIMTVEDPVEYKLPKMAQIGVNPKINLTFATGLRHILRQDPDVIMIGEIRDRETAEIAIQASLTGHLVLSTLHTNDAPSALTRLVDMGIEPYLLASTVVSVLAQRLVRTICPYCKVSYEPSEGEIKELGLSWSDFPEEKLFFKGEGCSHCFGFGYKGRHGVYELMPLTGPLKRQLVQSADASLLVKLAKESGMRSLREEGAELIFKGITTCQEILRVTRGLQE